MGIWHVPWLYDLTLRSASAHYLEHVTFLALGVLFWLPVIDSPPLHPRLGELQRVAYVTAGATTGWLLSIVLAFAPTPLYGTYAALPHRWGGPRIDRIASATAMEAKDLAVYEVRRPAVVGYVLRGLRQS